MNADLRERIQRLADKHYLSLSSMAHIILAWGADKFEGGSSSYVVEPPVHKDYIVERRIHEPLLTEVKGAETVPIRSAGVVGRPRNKKRGGVGTKRKVK